MSETQTIYIACERYEVMAAVGPSESATPLERLVLEAIGHGVEDLDGIFCLGQRPMVDLLAGLLRNDYITVHPRTSEIRLTAAVRQLFADKRLHELATTYVTEMAFPVIREMVSGHLLPELDSLTWKLEGIPAPESKKLFRGALPPETRDEFVSALAESARQRLPEDDDRKLLTARIPQPEAGEVIPTRRQYLRLAARVFRRADTADLVFQIELPSELPLRIRKDIGEALSALAKQSPTEVFFKNLDTKVPVQDERREGGEAILDFLRQQAGAPGEPLPANVQQRHSRLVIAREELLDFLKTRESRMADVDLVVGATAIAERIRAAILSTRTQLVLACGPRGTAGGLAQFRDALGQLLNERPVQVFVLWGTRYGEEMDPRFFGVLEGLKREARLGELHYAPVSCRTNARLLVRDADLALVGSYAFLHDPAQRGDAALEVAAEVRSCQGEEVAQALLELLARTRDTYSDVVKRNAILTERSEFGAATHAGERFDWQRGTPVPATFAGFFGPPPVVPGSRGDQAATRVWSTHWRTLIEDLEEWLKSEGPYATPVYDHQHRPLLMRALRSAEREVLVVSPELTSTAVDDRLVYLLRQRLETSALRVVVLFGRDARNARRPLVRLADRYPDRLRVIECEVAARLLVWDDEVLVSSASPLGEDRSSLGNRDGLVSEFGYQLRAPGLAGRVLDALAAKFPEHRRFLDRLGQARAGPEGAGEAPPAEEAGDVLPHDEQLQAMLAALHAARGVPPRRAEAARSYFDPLDKGTEGPWRTLDLLERSNLDPADLETCAAACLADPAAYPHPAAGGWIRFLAERAWEDGRFAQAAAFTAACGGLQAGGALPSRRAIELAALSDAQEPFCRRLLEIAVEEPVDYTEAESAAVLALVALTRHGWSDAADYLDERAAEIPAALLPAAQEQLDFWRRFGQPLPFDALGGRRAVREALTESRDEREALLSGYEHARLTNYNFEIGKRTLQQLFAGGQPLPRLERAAQAGDVAVAREWLARHCRDSRAIERLIDEASDRAMEGTAFAGEHIEGGRRAGLVKRIQVVVRAARGWVDAEAAGNMDPKGAVLDAAVALVERLLPSLAEVSGELEARRLRRDPVQPLVAVWWNLMQPLFPAAPEARR